MSLRLNLSDVDLNLKDDTAAARRSSRGDMRGELRERINSTTEEERLDDIAVAAAIAEVEEELKKESDAIDVSGYLFVAVFAVTVSVTMHWLKFITIPYLPLVR